MNEIFLQENMTEALTKPSLGELKIEHEVSQIFNIETGILQFVNTSLLDLEIKSTQLETIFKLSNNTITLCKLERYNSNEPKYWYTILSKVTSYSYKSVKNPEWKIDFLTHDGDILHSDDLNKYITYQINNEFFINCDYKDFPIFLRIDLQKCEWFNIWKERCEARWKVNGGIVIKC